jgi:hypothetical protein
VLIETPIRTVVAVVELELKRAHEFWDFRHRIIAIRPLSVEADADMVVVEAVIPLLLTPDYHTTGSRLRC